LRRILPVQWMSLGLVVHGGAMLLT
jgi:hypothetical protein